MNLKPSSEVEKKRALSTLNSNYQGTAKFIVRSCDYHISKKDLTMNHDKETEHPTNHYMKQNMKELHIAHLPAK